MNRRDFIKTSLGGALTVSGLAGGYAWWNRSRSADGWILGGGRWVRDGKVQNLLVLVDVARSRSKYVELEFLPHGVIFDPRDPERALMFEKIGPGACEVNLSTGEVIRSIQALVGHQFYGHGAFSPDGKVFYATETRTQDQAGVVVVRDARTSKIIGELPTFGENPHECLLVGQGRVMIVTNGGGAIGTDQRGSVTYVDVETKKLIRRDVVEKDEWNTGHLAQFDGPEGSGLVVVSAPRRGLSDQNLGGISVQLGAQPLRALRGPDEILRQLQGEALSICIHPESQTFGVTHPLGNLVTFWSLRDQSFKNSISIERPRGLTLTADRQAFLLSYGNSASLVQVDADQLRTIDGTRIENAGLAGSHLYHWRG